MYRSSGTFKIDGKSAIEAEERYPQKRSKKGYPMSYGLIDIPAVFFQFDSRVKILNFFLYLLKLSKRSITRDFRL